NGQPVDLTSFTASATDDSGEDFVEASAGSQQGADGHSHGGAKDSHGRSQSHEHYGHDHK
ncbi:MAG: hypothetical protein JWM70_822, partial [Microbacteriaceae bacterium]|nr:hypothetical protein [Microbacteriaceae bacterium]